MDINKLFKSGENTCGRVMSILPEKEIGSPKQFMMDVLQDETLPSINDLCPRVFRTTIQVSDLIPIQRADMTNYVGYRIPLKLTEGLKIRGIRSLHCGTSGYDNNNSYMRSYTQGYIGTPNKFGRYSSANLYEAAMASLVTYADLQLMGTLQEAPIPRFEPPNIMWINKTYQSAQSFFVTFLLENDPNLISVSDELYEAVKKLFLLDLKKTIYNRYGMLSTVDTSIGTIDLKIDDWSGAAQERDELFEQYDSLSHIRKGCIIAG